ncbi:MAG: YlqD family protein [Clostridia bacterium]|nr:YlqD family protein [Clostridia bacterium]MDD4146564.1 YlqD family protein [Clostridia bacterium]MDD4665644.1 YlqD family protein [Clostridia bacterium]
MEKLIINRKIKIKIRVTDAFKTQVIEELQEGINKLDAELKFLEQRAKKMITELTLKASPQVAAVREQLEYEKQKREETRMALAEQMKIAGTLENGNEVMQGEIEGPLEVKVGDKWEEIMQREIVFEEGRIIAIR